MEALIIHCHTLFDDQLNPTAYGTSPPLPPAPLGEIPPPVAYGSTHTKFSEYGSQQQINVPPSQTPTPQASTSDDFTPQLPPRPPASIHPSSRGNNGSANGLSNTSPIRSEAETNLTSPISNVPSLPLPLRPGRQGGMTPVQGLRGTKGLDFSQQETGEGEWTGPAPTSPPLSDPPTPPPSAFKSLQIPPPPPSSVLPQSTFALQQQQPASTQILTQDPQQKAQPPLPSLERTSFGDFESISSHLEASSSSTVDDGHSSDYASPITPDAPTGPTLQLVTPQNLARPEPPIKAGPVQEQSQPTPVDPLRQPDEIPRARPEDLPPSQLQ